VARYSLFIKPSAKKELVAAGHKRDRQRLVARILELAENPRPADCRKLSGADKYRIRCGDYRLVYSIEDEALIGRVVKIGHRRDVYR
jgi:mRNA interferase RelE/StbE